MPAATLTCKEMDFEAQYRAHFACVWRALRRLGIPEADAQDATQEVFLTAYRRLEEFQGRSSVKTWLIGIAYRIAANQRRTLAGRREVSSEEAIAKTPFSVDVEQQLENREELRQLERVLAQLPLEQRGVFTMFEMEGLTGEEIAEALDLPLGTVRSRLRLARHAFIAASDSTQSGTGASA